MQDQDLIKKIPLYFQCELSPEEDKAFEKALQNSPKFARKVELYKAMLNFQDTLNAEENIAEIGYDPTIEPSQENLQNAREFIDSLRNRQEKKHPSRLWLYASAMCLFALAVVMIIVRSCSSPTPTGRQDAHTQKNTTAKDTLKKTTTPIGKDTNTQKLEKDLPAPKDEAKPAIDTKPTLPNLPAIPKKDSIVPKKDTLEVIAQNFERNASFDARITQSKSAVQPISVASPAIDQNFTKTIRFDFKDSKPENVSYTVEIINNDEQSIMTKTFALSEVPFEIDFSEQTRGLYYWRLRKNGVQVYLGRFLFRK